MAITLVQITDTHIHDRQSAHFKDTLPDESLISVIQHAKKLLTNIDHLVITGDLTHDGTEASCIRLANILGHLDCPVYVTLGNHDSNQVIHSHLLNDQISMPDSIELNHWQLLFADSHIENQTEGLITDSGLAKLRNQLSACKKSAALFTHHPPVKINSLWMDRIGMKNGPQVLQQLGTYQNLKSLAFGHIHQQWRSKYKHIEILGSPSSCVQFKAGSDDFAIDDQLPGYRVFKLHDNGELESEVIRLQH